MLRIKKRDFEILKKSVQHKFKVSIKTIKSRPQKYKAIVTGYTVYVFSILTLLLYKYYVFKDDLALIKNRHIIMFLT